jgi:hypothetical protein
MGLFDKLFNDDEKEREEEAKRKAAEKYATDHAHGAEDEAAHADGAHAHAHTAAAPAVAKKSAAKKAAPAAVAVATVTAAAPEKKAPAKKAAVAAQPTASPAVIPHQHVPAGSIPHQGATTAGAVTVAHDQAMTIHLLSHIPDHAPREGDPHYHLFEQAKSRLKRQGLWKCMINDDLCEGGPELHHTFIEFSQINEVDPVKIEQSLGLHFDTDEAFQEWAESPGNLEVLCANHHRAHYGIHVIPGPLWEALRFRKAGTEAAAEFVSGADAAKEPAN